MNLSTKAMSDIENYNKLREQELILKAAKSGGAIESEILHGSLFVTFKSGSTMGYMLSKNSCYFARYWQWHHICASGHDPLFSRRCSPRSHSSQPNHFLSRRPYRSWAMCRVRSEI